jgi:DNA-binding phage protein
MKGFTMNLKSLKLQELTHKTLKQIAEDAGITYATLYNNLRPGACPTMRFAQKLESTTGISHQFFLYDQPLCFQFANKKG